MTPFIEQIDPNLESAARVHGATPRACSCMSGALLAPGILGRRPRAGAHHRDVRAHRSSLPDPYTQTLVVALYYGCSPRA